MKVWIDRDLCTGDGLCEEIAPDVLVLLDDSPANVREGAVEIWRVTLAPDEIWRVMTEYRQQRARFR